MPDLEGAYSQPVSGPAGVSALYMAQTAAYIGQLAFLTRCLVAATILLVILLLGGLLYLRSLLTQVRKPAEAAAIAAEQALRGLSALRAAVKTPDLE